MFRKTFIIVAVLLLSVGLAFAQSIGFEATVNQNRIPLNSSVELTLTLKGVQVSEDLQIPEIPGFQIQYQGASRRVTIINGQPSKSSVYSYILYPEKTGRHVIPAFHLDVEGKTLATEPIAIDVVEGQDNTPQTSSGESISLENRLFLNLDVPGKNFVLQERIPITVRMYVAGLAVRDIEMPQFDNSVGLRLEEYGQPNQYQEVIRGIRYNVVEFKTFAYPTRTGSLTLGPAKVACNILYQREKQKRSMGGFDRFFDDDFFDGFFNRYDKRPVVVSSDSRAVEVVPLPEEGKPADFSGGVGDYAFNLNASPLELKEGDPITVVMKVSGEGNLNAPELPAFKETQDFKVYEPQIKEENGAKVIEQVLIPRSASVKQIPEMRFSFFNPRTGHYETITRGPIDLKVSPAPQSQGYAVPAFSPQMEPSIEETLGKDLMYIKDSPGTLRAKGSYLYQTSVFPLFYAAVLLMNIVLFLFLKWKRRLHQDTAFARRFQAPKQAKGHLQKIKDLFKARKISEVYDEIFKVLQEYFGNKFGLVSGAITFRDMNSLFAEKKVKSDIVRAVGYLFEECDRVRFASSSSGDEQKILKDITLCEEVIDYFERIIK